MRDLADKAQVCTQRSWKRPYGVGLLVGGFDKTGAKLYYNCPSGNYYEYKANAVGARSQARSHSTIKSWRHASACRYELMLAAFLLMLASIIACVTKPLHPYFLSSCSALSSCPMNCLQAARTYLERKFEEFESCSLDQLIRHSLQVWLLAFLMLVLHLSAGWCRLFRPS